MIIGITGTYRAGKGTVAEYLVAQKSFKHYSVSGYLEEYLRGKGVKNITRDILIAAGNELREKFGADFIVKELFSRARDEGGNIIIESIRNPREAEFIKSQKNSILLAIDADPLLRYKRAQKAKTIKDDVSFKEFVAQEIRESSSTDPNSQNLRACIQMADIKIMNNDTESMLFREIESELRNVQMPGKERRS